MTNRRPRQACGASGACRLRRRLRLHRERLPGTMRPPKCSRSGCDVRWICALGVVLAASTVVAGCSNCEAKCIAAQAEVTVANNVAAVEVCTTDAVCTRQEFGPPNARVLSRSFRLTTGGSSSQSTIRVRVFDAAGRDVSSSQATARAAKGSCGCSGPAQFFVGLDGVHVMSNT